MTQVTAKTIFVAGASGAIGRRLCPLLVTDGWQVFGTTRDAGKTSSLQQQGVVPVVVDVLDQAALLHAVAAARPSVIMHQLTDLPYALDPARMAAARARNARLREVGTRNLVGAAIAAGATRMVAQSLAFVYAAGPMPYVESAPLDIDNPATATTVHAILSLEQQVLHAPLAGIVLRYGKLYGPGTGFSTPPAQVPLHIDAAAQAARLAASRGAPGIYNIAADERRVSCRKAHMELGWQPRVS